MNQLIVTWRKATFHVSLAPIGNTNIKCCITAKSWFFCRRICWNYIYCANMWIITVAERRSTLELTLGCKRLNELLITLPTCQVSLYIIIESTNQKSEVDSALMVILINAYSLKKTSQKSEKKKKHYVKMHCFNKEKNNAFVTIHTHFINAESLDIIVWNEWVCAPPIKWHCMPILFILQSHTV